MRILAISGSLRSGSFNTGVARAAIELAPDGVEVELYDELGQLPPFDQDRDGEDASAEVRDLRERIAAADAVLFVTPEYNGSIPGVLKNAIDWASRPRSDAALAGKTVAVAGATTGQYGALWAQQDLRRVLGIAGARVLEGELPVARAQTVFDESGRLVDAGVADRLRRHLESLVAEASPIALAA
ncbi:MAG: NAD(P)H-dependent oxidoreductase [Gaiellaceae bacterium]